MKIKKSLKSFWKNLGAGLITGISDDDPSGIATYSQAGASFGYGTLWTALATYPLMFAIQEMSGRIGKATSCGLANIIAKHYPKVISYLVLLAMFPALVINIAANLAGMSAVSALLLPLPNTLFSTAISVFLLFGFLFSSYKKITNAMKFCCLTLLIYFLVPFFEDVQWKDVAIATIVPDIDWNRDYFKILIAILGTTISPYLFFWQASLCVEEGKHTSKNLNSVQKDINVGMLSSNLIMFFIILSTGAVLYPAGIRDIETVEQAAKALEPIAGESAYIFFSIGILASGFLAIPVLAGCAGFLFAEVFSWKCGLDLQPNQAIKFYFIVSLAIVLAWLLTFTNINPMDALIFAAMLYGLIAPFIIGLILLICNNKAIMKGKTNGWLSNTAGIIVLLLMSGAAIAMFTL